MLREYEGFDIHGFDNKGLVRAMVMNRKACKLHAGSRASRAKPWKTTILARSGQQL